MDCLDEFKRLEAEVAGGDLTGKEAYDGARLEFLEDCLDVVDFINLHNGCVDG